MTTNLEVLAEMLRNCYGIDDLDPDLVETIEEGEWVQYGKRQICETFLKFNGEYFRLQENRTGSYHTDWYYSESYISPVERREETKVVVSWPTAGHPIELPARD